MADLTFIHSVMRNNKSTEILTKVYDDKQQNKKVMVFTSAIDDRHGVGKITSRIKSLESIDAIPITPTTNILKIVSTFMPDKIYVDEAQFLTKRNIREIEMVALELNIPVYCYGLLSTSNNEIFEGAAHLLVCATKVIEKERECWFCTNKATKNLRMVDGKPVYNGEIIMIGDSEYYPVCGKHFYNPPKGA